MLAYSSELSRRRQKPSENVNDRSFKKEQEKKPLVANFSLVAGTDLLEKQLQLIKPKIHIFG